MRAHTGVSPLARLPARSVAELMTPDPICVRPNTRLEDAANLLLRLKIRRLPVVDETGKLTGARARMRQAQTGRGHGRGAQWPVHVFLCFLHPA